MTIPAGETIFLDTNILLTATDEDRPGHAAARDLFDKLPSADFGLALSGQICREYLVVATRRIEQNGLGLETTPALANIREFRKRTRFCEENETVWERLAALTGAHRIAGKKIHDANVAATMAAHGIEWLLTENLDDFAAFPALRPINLASLRLA